MLKKEFCVVCCSRAEKYSYGLLFCSACLNAIEDTNFCKGDGRCYLMENNQDIVTNQTTFVHVPCIHNCQLQVCQNCHTSLLPVYLISSCECLVENSYADINTSPNESDEPTVDDDNIEQ